MQAVTKLKIPFTAAVVALAIEGVCIFLMQDVGPDGPGSPFSWIGIILLFPATMLGGLLGGMGGYGGILIGLFGFLEFFVPCWLFLRRKHGKKAA